MRGPFINLGLFCEDGVGLSVNYDELQLLNDLPSDGQGLHKCGWRERRWATALVRLKLADDCGGSRFIRTALGDRIVKAIDDRGVV